MKRRGSRTVSLRLWLVLALVAVAGLPTLTTWGLSAAMPGWKQQAEQRQLTAVRRVLGSEAARWRDPAWQQNAERALAALGVEVGLVEKRGPDQGVVFATAGARRLMGAAGLAPLPALPGAKSALARYSASTAASTAFTFRELAITASAPPGARAVADLWLTRPPAGLPAEWLPQLGGLTVLLLTLAVVALALGRFVLRPLAAMGQAAARVADGHLDIRLPPSPAAEVAAVSAALEEMSAGLREAVRRQAELEQERRLFIGAVAHDLRTPLFTLSAYLDGLRDGLATTPERTAHYVEACREQSAALERLVSDLFAFSRLEYLEQQPRREPLELGVLLREAVARWEPRATAQASALALAGSPEPCVLHGDASLLSRAVENLLDNALRYTPSGGRVEVGWRRDGEMAIVTVADSGPGLAEQDLPYLFTPLYRGETSRNRQTGGAGLGLSIARRILQAHGGDLLAANRSGGGAVFTVTLPADTQARTATDTQARTATDTQARTATAS
jgi:signal transduction histidine kinase